MGEQIIALVPDLMLSVRIEAVARRAGRLVETAASEAEALARLSAGSATLLIIDLATPGLDLDRLAEAARDAGVPVLGFFPHVNVETRRAALRSGIERVIPRRKFLEDLPTVFADDA